MFKLERTESGGWELSLTTTGAALLGALVIVPLLWLAVDSWRLRTGANQPATPTIQAGDVIPGIQVESSEPEAGATNLLAGAEAHSLLLFATTTCPYCARSIDDWDRLRETVPSTVKTRVVLLDGSTAPDWGEIGAAAAGGDWDLVMPTSLAAARELGITGVPTTVLVDRDGVVLASWIGELTEDTVVDIRNRSSSLPQPAS